MGKSVPRHGHAHGSRYKHGRDAADACLPHHQVSEEISPLHCTKARKQEPEEQETCQRDKVGVAIESCYQRCQEPQDDVQASAHYQIEPENSVVLPVGRFLLVAQGGNETALLQGACQGGKDVEHIHLAPVGRSEQSHQRQTEQSTEQLHYAIAHTAPDEAACRAFFQRFLAHNSAKVTIKRAKKQKNFDFSERE